MVVSAYVTVVLLVDAVVVAYASPAPLRFGLNGCDLYFPTVFLRGWCRAWQMWRCYFRENSLEILVSVVVTTIPESTIIVGSTIPESTVIVVSSIPESTIIVVATIPEAAIAIATVVAVAASAVVAVVAAAPIAIVIITEASIIVVVRASLVVVVVVVATPGVEARVRAIPEVVAAVGREGDGGGGVS